MKTAGYPVVLPKPTLPGAVPCYRSCTDLGEIKPTGGRRTWWDERCQAILRAHVGLPNGAIADLIAAHTGLRFTDQAIGRRRSALGLDRYRGNDHTAPLRRWQPWQGRGRA
jgi:hypothetical protein